MCCAWQATLLRFADEFGSQRLKQRVANFMQRVASRTSSSSPVTDADADAEAGIDILAELPEQLRQYVLAAPSFAFVQPDDVAGSAPGSDASNANRGS